MLETNPSIYISFDDAIYLAVKELGRRVGRTAVTAWVKKNSLGVRTGERYGGHWLIHHDLFKECLIQIRKKRFKRASL